MPDICTAPPNFTLTNYQNNSGISLSDYNGKVILMSFMSIVCGHCMQWLQHLQQIQDDYAANPDVQILGILFKSGGQVTAQDVQTMLASAGVAPTFPLLMDSGATEQQYMAGLTGPLIGFPFSYMISKAFVITNKWHRRSTPNGDPVCFDSGDQDDTEYFVRFRIDDLLSDRDPWDTVLALDYSDTMNDAVTIGGITQPKINFLQEAVSTFLKVWKDYALCQDKIGVVYFSCHAVSNGNLVQILPGANIQSLISDMESQNASGCTAMGAGLATGLHILESSPNKRFVVLFTDGMQNRNPLVYRSQAASLRIDNIAQADYPPPLTWLCTCAAGDGGQSNYAGALPVVLDGINVPIHTIGIGVPGSWQQMLQDMSLATVPTGQFKMDVQVWPNVKEFFIEILIDLYRGNSLQLVAKNQGTLAAGEQSRVETFILNKSVRKLTVLLSWVGKEAPLTFKLRKNGTTINLSHKATEDVTYRFVTLSFPHYQENKIKMAQFQRLNLKAQKVLAGEMAAQAGTMELLPLPWGVKELIEAEGHWEVIIERTFQNEKTSIPYHLMILADDKVLEYAFRVPPRVFYAGESIPVAIEVLESLKPIEKIFSAEVIVHRPTVAVNDLLSKYKVKEKTIQGKSVSGDVAPGPLYEKIEKLMHDKKAMASLMKTQQDIVSLKRVSKVKTGKMKDPKGSYQGFYENTRVPGIYKLDFKIKGVGERCGVFERVESRTVLVMPKSDQKIAKKEKIIKKKKRGA